MDCSVADQRTVAAPKARVSRGSAREKYSIPCQLRGARSAMSSPIGVRAIKALAEFSFSIFLSNF